ncbi:dihydrodipicolinate synthase family protein [Escherichia coli]
MNRYWKSSPKRRKAQLNLRIAHVGCVSTAESQQLAASAKRYGFDACCRHAVLTILSALKNTAITIGQLLIRRMVCRWWCTTFQP